MSEVGKELTVQHLFDEAEKWGAAKMQVVFSDENDVPTHAVIVVKGQPETSEIIAAVEAVQDLWDKESE